jgi:hypothetical protein
MGELWLDVKPMLILLAFVIVPPALIVWFIKSVIAGFKLRKIKKHAVRGFFFKLDKPTGKFWHVRVKGVTFDNPDGSSRQDIVKSCRPSEDLILVREPNNKHDPDAMAVYDSGGRQLGYYPAGESELARHIDRGGACAAEVVEVIGGSEDEDESEKHYGCVIEIKKYGARSGTLSDTLAVNRATVDYHANETKSITMPLIIVLGLLGIAIVAEMAG